MLASISTVPFAVKADPRPELNKGFVSSSLTCQKRDPKIMLSSRNGFHVVNIDTFFQQ
jgi:hypothetical protein